MEDQSESVEAIDEQVQKLETQASLAAAVCHAAVTRLQKSCYHLLPVGRLPLEILSAVLVQSVDSKDWSALSVYKRALDLSLVCRFWQQTIEATRQFWETIVTDYPPGLIGRILSKSFHLFIRHARPHPQFDDAFRLICEVASRWRYAQLIVNASQRQVLELSGPKPNLQHLDLIDVEPESGPVFRLEGVPALQELVLNQAFVDWDTFVLPDLRRLTIDGQLPTTAPTLSGILGILSRCSHLEFLTAGDLKDAAELPMHGTQQLIELPNMCELNLNMHVDHAHHLLSYLHTPNCRTLSFRMSLIRHTLPHNIFDNDHIVRIIQTKVDNEGTGHLYIYSQQTSLEVMLSTEGFTLAMQLDGENLPYATVLPSLSHALARARRHIYIKVEIGFWSGVPSGVFSAFGLMHNIGTLIYRRDSPPGDIIDILLAIMSSPTFGEEGRFLFHDVSQLELDIEHALKNLLVFMVEARHNSEGENPPVPFSKIILDQLKTNVEDSEPFIQKVRGIIGQDNVVWRPQ